MPLESFQNGRYRIVRPLGSGSMGEVYLVEDTRINRQVAIKVIRFDASSYLNDEAAKDAVRLFEREAKAIAQLNHPNILPLFDYGEESINGSTVTYMVMPYCPDGSFMTWLQLHEQDAPLSPQDTAHFVREAADALQHAHEHDIIHQDVKPSNFLLRGKKTGLPDILLADFGIAKLAASTSGASHVVRGTPMYMAPEQWEGHPVPASDQYALAVMTYQMLTGRLPFQGGPSQMMYQHINVSPMPPSSVNAALSPELDTVLLRALAKRPGERYPSIAAFADAFQQTLPTLDQPTILNTEGRNMSPMPAFDDNRPTMIHQTSAPTNGAGAIQATLAISAAEALAGTTRALMLQGGQRVTVAIPPGVQNGQVIRVNDGTSTLVNGNLSAPLLLTIAVVPAFNDYNTVQPDDRQTMIGANPLLVADADQPTVQNNALRSFANQPTTVEPRYPSMPPQSNAGYDATIPPIAPIQPPFQQPQSPEPPQRPKRTSSGLIIAALIFVLLIILISGSLLFYVVSNNAATNTKNNNLTATAGTLASNATGTAGANDSATAQAQTTATAKAQATAIGQANVNATATANSQNNASATATAQAGASANATATAQAGANATATAGANATATAGANPVISHGTGTIPGTFHFSFDTGTQVTSGDVWWNIIDTTQRQMTPQGSATIVNLGVTDFNAITFTTLQGESYGTTPIDGNNDSTNQLVNGDVFAVHTNGGNFAKVMVVAYGQDIQVQWVTYHG